MVSCYHCDTADHEGADIRFCKTCIVDHCQECVMKGCKFDD